MAEQILLNLTEEEIDQVDWYMTSISKRISLDFIDKHDEFPWMMDAVISRADITKKFILEQIRGHVAYAHIALHSNFTVQDICELTGLTVETIIERHLVKPLEFRRIDIDFIRKHSDKFDQLQWDTIIEEKDPQVLMDAFPKRFREKDPTKLKNPERLKLFLSHEIRDDFVIRHVMPLEPESQFRIYAMNLSAPVIAGLLKRFTYFHYGLFDSPCDKLIHITSNPWITIDDVRDLHVPLPVLHIYQNTRMLNIVICQDLIDKSVLIRTSFRTILSNQNLTGEFVLLNALEEIRESECFYQNPAIDPGVWLDYYKNVIYYTRNHLCGNSNITLEHFNIIRKCKSPPHIFYSF